MLKRLLASIALLSLLLAGVLLVYWWRSLHGHIDTFHLGATSPNQTDFTTTHDGRVSVRVLQNYTKADTRFHPFKELLGYCLIFPCLWMAIKIRNLLPRPPGRR